MKNKKFSFEEHGIKTGSKLSFTRDPNITATVISAAKIRYEGEEYSLSGLTLYLLNTKFDKNWKAARGIKYWSYKGTTLSELNVKSS